MKNTLQDSYTIKIHSFINLISNSSTEIYVAANEHTIQSVKEIINGILKVGDSNFECDDLFTVELGESRDAGEYYTRCNLIVKCKDTTNPVGATTAELLSSLTSLFSIEAAYNG
jgi:hypothetical protein